MYTINFWGRHAVDVFLRTVSEKYIENDNGKYSYFFDDLNHFNQSKDFIRNVIKENNYHVMLDFIESDIAHYKVIAKMKLVYNGKRYPYEYSFGYGYNPDSAHYMFFEGNYACDCNLYDFLYETYGEELGEYQEHECGESIVIEDFEIILKHFEEGK